MPLPDAVMQGLGWAPPPVDSSIAGAPPTLPTPDAPPPLLPTIPGMGPTATPAAAASSPQPSATPAVTSGAPSLDLPPSPPVTLPSASAAPAPELAPADSTARNPGADFNVPLASVGGAPAAGAPAPSRPSQPPSPGTPDQRFTEQARRADQATGEQQQAIADQTSVDRAKARGELEAMDRANARTKAIEDEQNLWRDEYKKTFAAKQAAVADSTKAIDSYKVDPNKFWKDMGVGQHVGYFIAMALSGIGAALNNKGGEPNPVIGMLQQKAHESIVAQMDQRDQLEKKYGRAEHDLDRYEAFSKDRDAQLKLRMAEVNQSLARDIATAAAKLGEPQAIARGEALSGELKATAAKQYLEATDKAATYDTQKKQLAVSQANAGTAAGELALNQRKFVADEKFRDWTKDKEQQRLDLDAAKAAIAAHKAGGAEDQKLGVAAPSIDGNVGMLTNKDGSVMHFRSPEIAQKTSDMIAGATAYNRLVGQMTRAIKDHGGESSWVKGPEWQKMMSDLQSATAELHDAYGITSFREPTVEFFEKMATAGVDPTSFVRNVSGALDQSNKNLQAKINEKLSAAGYNGARLAFAPTDAPEAKPGPVQRLATLLKTEPSQNPSEAHDKTFNQVFKATGDIVAAKQAAVDAEGAARRGDISPDQKQGIANLEAIAKAGGPDGQAAIATLQDVVRSKDEEFANKPKGVFGDITAAYQKQSASPIRALAAAALERAQAAPAPPPATTSSAGPAYDPNAYDPESLVKRFHAPVQPTVTP